MTTPQDEPDPPEVTRYREFWKKRKGKMVLSQKEPEKFGEAVTLLFDLRRILSEGRYKDGMVIE